MSDAPPLPHTLQRALVRLLRPLARVMLRHQLSFRAFEALARHVYVDVAMREFGIDRRPATISRVSILSGLTRKDVQRLLAEGGDGIDPEGDRYNRATRVVSGWVRDADFHDAAGHPRALAVDGPMGFAELVRRHSGDMPAKAVLDELLQRGTVALDAEGHVVLQARAYLPQGTDAKLEILGHDVADLITTIDHNLRPGQPQPRFQRKVMYDAIPLEALPPFRALSRERAQAVLEEFDRWLAAHDLDTPADAAAGPRARVGVGIYYFEEVLDAEPASTRPRHRRPPSLRSEP